MEEYEEYNSDEEINKKQHARLIDEVFQLDKTQYVKKPTRTEPAIQVSEFNLTKPKAGRKSLINVNDLTKSLRKKEKHAALTQKVKNIQNKSKTLITPASKPEADRIRRSLGYEKVSSELGKWQAIVEKNRVVSHISFPLDQGELHIVDNKETRNEYKPRYKSELDIELEKLDPPKEQEENDVQFPLSMEELYQRRKEMAKLRAHQSYLEAKAYKRNKIKSKTFHKVQKKEKLKEKIKEFEVLKKTDPEAALQKLEELEKVRAEERMSLRHRSTGHWAKNKHVQAKYNKESRQALAQQLALSRELTQKMKVNESSDSENEPEPEKPIDTTNPWIANRSDEMKEFISGYRKFWNEQNNKNAVKKEQNTNDRKGTNPVVEYIEFYENDIITNGNSKINVDNEAKNNKREKIMSSSTGVEPPKKKKKRVEKVKKSKPVNYCSSKWDIEVLFDDLEIKTKKKLEEKLHNLKSCAKKKVTEREDLTLNDKRKESDLSMPREKFRPIIDEELGGDVEETNNDKINEIIKMADMNKTEEVGRRDSDVESNKYSTVKTVDIDTALPTVSIGNENLDEEENDQTAFISEAFEDDDVVAEFIKEKQDIINNEKPQDIDLSLPGWGSWGGKDIPVSKRKRRRFIVKMPKELPRKDKNKAAVIINEKKNSQLDNHRVSDLPFPFTCVKDFEASIRAPIGDTFVPQTAFTKLIKPAVSVPQGTIVEPMSKEILLKQKFIINGRLVR